MWELHAVGCGWSLPAVTYAMTAGLLVISVYGLAPSVNVSTHVMPKLQTSLAVEYLWFVRPSGAVHRTGMTPDVLCPVRVDAVRRRVSKRTHS